MTRIVTTHYRYKRPPRKRKPVALDMQAVVTRTRKHDVAPKQEPVSTPPANDDRKSAIVTIRRKGRAAVADMTSEEHQRRGDAAEALFQEMKRRIAEKIGRERAFGCNRAHDEGAGISVKTARINDNGQSRCTDINISLG